jgi:hypothetical protein
MTILTMKYKYKVLQRLLKSKENFKEACSKAGLSVVHATDYLKNTTNI